MGEKTAWESTGQLASVLKKLNAQSLHPRLGTRLNNALLQADGVDHRDAVGGLGFGFVYIMCNNVIFIFYIHVCLIHYFAVRIPNF